jgi:nucleotide-binding universal stress UspA family protein
MTGLRDIVVVLDDSTLSEARLAIAVALAKQHGAHLTGLSALDVLKSRRSVVQRHGAPEADTPHMTQVADWSGLRSGDYLEAEAQAAETAERIEATFKERLRIGHVEGDWRMTSGKLSEAAVLQARNADLVIVGQADPEHPSTGGPLVEDLLMTAGRPMLIIPYVGHFATLGTTILVGWTNSREATRAVNDAIPLLAKAASVTVLSARPSGRKPATHDATGAEITRHLARHGIRAEAAQTVMTRGSASDVLLSYAADVSADLLVVGGYGHSRLRELVLGGVTRDLLHHMTLPVLMSH